MNTRHQGTHRFVFASISFLLFSWLPPGVDGDFMAHATEIPADRLFIAPGP